LLFWNLFLWYDWTNFSQNFYYSNKLRILNLKFVSLAKSPWFSFDIIVDAFFFLRISDLLGIFWIFLILRIILFYLRIHYLVVWFINILNIYLSIFWALLEIWSLNNFSLFDCVSTLILNEFLILNICPFSNIFILFNLSQIFWIVINWDKIVVFCLNFSFLFLIELSPFLNVFQV
jgi:hypothetical protein